MTHTDNSTQVAVILVAGTGTRLGPLAAGRPKSLVDVAGETLLSRAVKTLRSVGVNHLILATGYREELLREAMAGLPIEVSYCRNEAFATTQNAVSLAMCAEAVGGRSFFKLDGDVLFDPEVLLRLNRAGGALAVAVDSSATLAEEEMKVLVENDRITAFGKELDPRKSAGESIGIERVDASLSKTLFDALDVAHKEGRTNIYYEAVYGELIAQGALAKPVFVSDLAWCEIDTAEDHAHAESLVRANKIPSPKA